MRMLTVYLITGLLIWTGKPCEAQNFIGLHKDEVIQIMKDSHKRLKLNTNVVNPHYNYLKFEDKINEITMLFFLSDKDICTNIRETYSYSNLTDVIERMNESYIPDGKDKWYYIDDGEKYNVVLTEKEWYFTVSIKREE